MLGRHFGTFKSSYRARKASKLRLRSALVNSNSGGDFGPAVNGHCESLFCFLSKNQDFLFFSIFSVFDHKTCFARKHGEGQQESTRRCLAEPQSKQKGPPLLWLRSVKGGDLQINWNVFLTNYSFGQLFCCVIYTFMKNIIVLSLSICSSRKRRAPWLKNRRRKPLDLVCRDLGGYFFVVVLTIVRKNIYRIIKIYLLFILLFKKYLLQWLRGKMNWVWKIMTRVGMTFDRLYKCLILIDQIWFKVKCRSTNSRFFFLSLFLGLI